VGTEGVNQPLLSSRVLQADRLCLLPLKPAAWLSYMDSWGTLVRVGQTCHRATSRERNHALSKRWLPHTKYTLRVLRRELALTLLSE
jgi:hypothetical protein